MHFPFTNPPKTAQYGRNISIGLLLENKRANCLIKRLVFTTERFSGWQD